MKSSPKAVASRCTESAMTDSTLVMLRSIAIVLIAGANYL